MSQVYLGNELISSLDSGDLKFNDTNNIISATNVQDAIREVAKKANNEVELTQAQYDALEAEGKIEADVNYYITDADDGRIASSVIYDNTSSGLTANTVQSAIDEIASGGAGHVEMTAEEYKALEAAGEVDPNTVYFITDGDGNLNADTIVYDNSASGMSAGTVQSAIDELNENKINFIDTTNILVDNTNPSDGSTYVATENCFINIRLVTNLNKPSIVLLNGYTIASIGVAEGTISIVNSIPLKKGDVITFESVSHGDTSYEVLGIR